MFYFLLPKLTNESEVGRNQQSGIFHALGLFTSLSSSCFGLNDLRTACGNNKSMIYTLIRL